MVFFVEASLAMGLSLGEMVCRRDVQHYPQLPGPASQVMAEKQSRTDLGRRRRRRTRVYLRRALSPGVPLRQCVESPWCAQGRSRRDLPSEDSRADGRDVGLCPDRRDSYRRVLRLQRACAREPSCGLRTQGDHHGRCRLRPRQGYSPETGRRSGRQQLSFH